MRSTGAQTLWLAYWALSLPSGAGHLSENVLSRKYSRRIQTHRQAQGFGAATKVFEIVDDEPQISFDFDDNTQGYCLAGYGLFNLEATQVLFKSHVEDVDLFLQTVDIGGIEVEAAIDLLQDYAQLTRVYLPQDIAGGFTDRQILLAVMFAQAEGPDRLITEECAAAIMLAVEDSVSTFNQLMGVGFFFDFDVLEVGGLRNTNLNEPIDQRLALSWILLQMEQDQVPFTRWIRTVLGFGEAFGEFMYFDDSYLSGVLSWEELALSPVSIVSKYASVFLTDGQLLQSGFDQLVINGVPATERFDQIYDQTVGICNMPTEPPSSSPTLGPDSANRLLPVVSVATFTLASSDQIRQSYESFRENYPGRVFCLLQPRAFDGGDLLVPRGFALDPLVRYRRISFDYGDTFFQSDWFDLCGLQDFANTGIGEFPLYLGLNTTFVNASLVFYEDMITSRGWEIVEVEGMDNLNWIEPLNRDF